MNDFPPPHLSVLDEFFTRGSLTFLCSLLTSSSFRSLSASSSLRSQSASSSLRSLSASSSLCSLSAFSCLCSLLASSSFRSLSASSAFQNLIKLFWCNGWKWWRWRWSLIKGYINGTPTHIERRCNISWLLHGLRHGHVVFKCFALLEDKGVGYVQL